MNTIRFPSAVRLAAELTAAVILVQAVSLMPAKAQQVEVSRKVVNYQTRGWEHNLVQRSPNLTNYFWNPQDGKKVLVTTRRTMVQAKHASESAPAVRHYIKPIHMPLPAKAKSAQCADSKVSARLCSRPGAADVGTAASLNGSSNSTVLTYSFNHFTDKRSVYGQIVP